MILLVLFALAGALLGVVVRPSLLAAPCAASLAGILRGLLGVAASLAVDNARAPFWAKASLAIVEQPLSGFPPVLCASISGALFSSVLVMLTDRRRTAPFLPDSSAGAGRPVRKGRYVRAPEMVSDRPAQSEAERRQRSVLGL